ncbi:LCP family protein [Micromonospora zhanjiangensis]|uniref:LCP family protein n=1 Tax=Micromonospora zhanjiangensis TaxID=1522057 RepID=A0ABV8KGS9_9ACTN
MSRSETDRPDPTVGNDDEPGTTPATEPGTRPATADQADGAAVVQKRRRRLRWYSKLAIVVGVLVVVLGGGGAIALKLMSNHYEGMVDRQDILNGVPTEVPEVSGEKNTAAKAPLNFLVLGTDDQTDKRVAGLDDRGSRSDTIMIVHVSGDRKRAFIASIPRDSYVNVPAGGVWGGGKNKINSAMSFGGANLAAKAVYDLTHIPLSGAMILNLNGVQAMVRAVGGVRVCIPYTVHSAFSPKVWEKGCHDLNPADAEEFVRQRKGTPGGDLGRIKNQQHVIQGLLQKVKQGGMLTDPGKLDNLISTAAKSLTVDKNTRLTDLALELKSVDTDHITFATAPIRGTAQTDAGSSVLLDTKGAEEMFAAIRADRTDEWLAAHPQPEVASL